MRELFTRTHQRHGDALSSFIELLQLRESAEQRRGRRAHEQAAAAPEHAHVRTAATWRRLVHGPRVVPMTTRYAGAQQHELDAAGQRQQLEQACLATTSSYSTRLLLLPMRGKRSLQGRGHATWQHQAAPCESAAAACELLLFYRCLFQHHGGSRHCVCACVCVRLCVCVGGGYTRGEDSVQAAAHTVCPPPSPFCPCYPRDGGGRGGGAPRALRPLATGQAYYSFI